MFHNITLPCTPIPASRAEKYPCREETSNRKSVPGAGINGISAVVHTARQLAAEEPGRYGFRISIVSVGKRVSRAVVASGLRAGGRSRGEDE